MRGPAPTTHGCGGSAGTGLGQAGTGTLYAFDAAYDTVTNVLARRLLIEAAWHHKTLYRPGKVMKGRWAAAPSLAAARGDVGNRRLHHRWGVYVAHKKKHTIANTAIARELAGWCWSLATMD